MMRGALKSFKKQRAESSHVAGRRGNFFEQILVALKEGEAALACSLDFVQIFRHALRRRKRFWQRPLKRVVPEVRRETAKSLLDRRRASEDVFAA